MRSLSRLLPLCFSLALLCAGDRFEDWHDEEVKWIISRAEKEEFKSLETEKQRRAFIEAFWKRRDPTPETERNEYKEEYYERFKYANENFREGIPGWRTDRGRIFILHGKPDVEEFITADSTFRRRGVPSSGSAPGLSSVGSGRQKIVWTYYRIPAARYYKGRLLLVFEPVVGMTQQDMTLGESITAQEHAEQLWSRGGVQHADLVPTPSRYRLTTVGRPGAVNSRGTDAPVGGIGDSARIIEDLLRSPGDILEENRAESERRLASRDELRQQVESSVSYLSLPVSMRACAFPEPELANLALAWQIPLESLRFEKRKNIRHAKLDLMVQVRDSAGELVDELFKPLDVYYTKRQLRKLKSEDLRYLNEFNLPPGRYSVFSVVKDVHGEALGSARKEVDIAPGGESVRLSDIVLSKSLTAEFDPGRVRNLIVRDWQILPQADAAFERRDKMVLYFKIYNAQANEGQPSLVASYKLLNEGQVVHESRPRALQAYHDEGSGTVDFSSIVDLSSLDPGPYRIQVSVIDYNAKKYAIERTRFEIR